MNEINKIKEVSSQVSASSAKKQNLLLLVK